MRTAVFSTKPYDKDFLTQANQSGAHKFEFLDVHLTELTAPLVKGFDSVCVFVNDTVDAGVIRLLAAHGVKAIALRCAGFNNVDLQAAHDAGIQVVHVPEYSPEAVAEHTVGLMLALNRKIHRAYNRVREGNFNLDGLMGFDMHGRRAGVVGTGRIGRAVVRILKGFGCEILAFDAGCPVEHRAPDARYVELKDIWRESDIITLHCPLTPETHHMVNIDTLAEMKDGVMLINTSRGALVDAPAVIMGLKSGKVGHLGIDVYEQEGDLFFEDLSGRVIQDDVFQRLITFPNVIVTGHQAFFTREALLKIARTTVENLAEVEKKGASVNSLGPERQVRKAG